MNKVILFVFFGAMLLLAVDNPLLVIALVALNDYFDRKLAKS